MGNRGSFFCPVSQAPKLPTAQEFHEIYAPGDGAT